MAKYHSGHQIKKNMGAKHLGRMGERCVAFRILVDKPEGNRPLGRPRLRWEDIIKKDFQEIGCGVWTVTIWLRIVTGGGHL